MKFDVKKIVALVLTLALVVTTITFTAGNSLKANELDEQQLGPKTEQDEVSVSRPEEKAAVTVEESSRSTEEEEIMEEEAPAVQEQTLKIAESKDNNSKKQIYIHNDGHLSYDSFYLVYGGGTVHFTKSNGDKYQSDSSAEGLEGDRVIQDGNKNELGTITLKKHGNGNNQDAGHAMDQYWISGFAPYEPSTPDPEPEPFAISVSADVLRTTYSGLPNSVEAKPSVAEGTTVYYSTDNGTTWSTTVPSITDVGVLYVKVKAENPGSTNKIAYGNFFIQVQPAQVIVKTKQRYEKNAGEPDPVFEATVSGLVNGEPESLIKYDIKKVPYNGNYIITPYGDAEQGNYYVKYETHPLIIKGKAPLEISVKGFDGEYDGKAHGEAAKVTKQGGAAPEGTKVEYSLDNGTTWSETVPTVTNVADSTSVLVRATCEDFDTVYENYSLTVSPKAVTVKTDKIDDVVYGEAMPTDFTATVKGTIGEDTVSYSISKSPAGNTVGEYTVTPSGEANQGNYTVSYEGTTFNVTESDGLTLTATGYRGIYDGAIHAGVVDASVTEGTTISYSIDNGNTWDVVPPTITNVGRIKVDVKAENPNYQTVQTKYFLRVAPKAVTVTADSFAIKYGEEVPELTAAVDGTIGKDKIDYTLTREEGTDIGEYAITFADPQTKQGNYRVSFVPGTLAIGSVDKIVLAGTDENVTYDGDKHSGGISSSVEDVTYEYSEDGENWTNKKPEYKDAGEYKYQVRASKEGYTTSDAIDVSVKISPKAIRIVSGSATKTYDGSALRNSEVNVYGLIEGEYFTVAATGEQTEVGSSDNNVEYEFGEVQNLEATAAKAENYEVEEVILGTLTVNPAPADEPVPVVDNNDGIGGGNVLVATGDANGGVQMTEIAAGSTPLAGGLLDSHCCILHLLIILAALIMLFWYTTDMKRRQKRIFELEEEINGKE